jgi:hypothetical protein
MKMTIKLDDDLVPALKKFAVNRKITVKKAVAELVRKGLGVRSPMRTVVINGFHVVDLPPDSPVVTEEDVRRFL